MNAAYLGATVTVKAPIAPRWYRGNLCGVHVSNLPPIDGGAPDPTLVLSWFYPRFQPDKRADMRAEWRRRRYLDVLLSWPDDRAFGLSASQHADMCAELCGEGFQPVDMLSSKVYDPKDDGSATLVNILPALNILLTRDVVSRYCVGWEMNLWNTNKSLQQIIDGVTALTVPAKRPTYVHFSPGYADWRPDHPGSTFAEFWNAQVGKLTGLFHQRDQSWTNDLWRAKVIDVLERFAGGYGVVSDNGFGHPFDFIALESSADDQFWGRVTEAQGDALGAFILATPPVHGVFVQGSGNGCLST